MKKLGSYQTKPRRNNNIVIHENKSRSNGTLAMKPYITHLSDSKLWLNLELLNRESKLNK